MTDVYNQNKYSPKASATPCDADNRKAQCSFKERSTFNPCQNFASMLYSLKVIRIDFQGLPVRIQPEWVIGFMFSPLSDNTNKDNSKCKSVKRVVGLSRKLITYVSVPEILTKCTWKYKNTCPKSCYGVSGLLVPKEKSRKLNTQGSQLLFNKELLFKLTLIPSWLLVWFNPTWLNCVSYPCLLSRYNCPACW